MDGQLAKTRWRALGIGCPNCGNDGRRGGKWEKYSSVPFKIVEDVIRSFEFSAEADDDLGLVLTVDTDTDAVDWESGTDHRFECMSCFKSFPLPEKSEWNYV